MARRGYSNPSCTKLVPGMNDLILRIDHIQLAAPKGCEDAARAFYGGLLGLREIEKPESLRGRGGCWFACGDHQLHIGVEAEFRPAKKAHPAFAVGNLAKLRKSLTAHSVPTMDDNSLPGTQRFFAEDPWGNRLEFLEAKR
jgi:catechol 2,3-dioxygenase-like lactoylglutathione lyase family enzyme